MRKASSDGSFFTKGMTTKKLSYSKRTKLSDKIILIFSNSVCAFSFIFTNKISASTNKNKPKKQKREKKETIPVRKVTERRSTKNAPSLPPPELIPPPPPGLSEELSDLLLSWFIAGYKTGTYSVKNQ